uniref:Uncharacterized protein n=1 Tax=Lactuca sativa TaxID=4236 RepID=A0A9R1WVB0_LACSA|nr:hypothetical protein LSAT_V11C900506540 [Lactuca sativa]
MSNISGDGGGSFSSGNTGGVLEEGQQRQTSIVNSHSTSTAADVGSTPQELLPDSSKKKKRSLPGTPDPSGTSYCFIANESHGKEQICM